MKWVKYAVAAWMGCAALVSGAQAEEAKATASANANAIEAINTSRNGNEIAIKIDLNKHMASPPASFAVSNPPKVALDFLGTVNALGKNTQQVNEGDLRSLNVVQVGDKTRVVLNLVRSMNYNTRVDGNSLYVTLTPIERVNDVAAERSQRFQEANPLSTGHAVRDLVFRRGKDGEGRVVVDLSDPGTAIDIRKQGANLVVDFIKTTLPENLRRKLDVTDFATPVLAVETKPVGQNTRLTISPKGAWEHNAYQADNQFIVEVKQIVEDPNKLVQGTKIGYQGPRVSINYQNGDVRALLRLMAEELGLNAVISETVTGTTTLVLKDVPADQVIDIIFQQKGLDMRKKGNIIMIAPRDEIATREKLDFESRQQIRELEPLQTEQFALNYQKAGEVAALLAGPGGASEAEAGSSASQRILSKRGSAVADKQSNILFVSDIPTKLEEIRAFIKTIDVGARQVLIEARIVEAQDSFQREIGAKLGLTNSRASNLGNSHWGVVGGKLSPSQIDMSKVTDIGVTQPTTLLTQAAMAGTNLPLPAKGGNLALSLFNSSLTRILNLEIAAMEGDGLGKVVSSPRVVTANNVKAKIEDGTEIPYVTLQSSGGTSTATVNFKAAKLSLEVVPQITPEGTVSMNLIVKKEEADWTKAVVLNGYANPPIKSSIVETNVVVDNGGTVVIGGVFITDTQRNVEKVPLLGDIPALGWLFKYRKEDSKRRELLVFITPRIISDKMSLN
ncbi:type 4a pilus secretin PilQ [Azonexus hydrophilus]|uniref:type IV pilus secretin family protein n=1 Tax=Azonexus hydrophilus TaxID=418702 RepID=UPI001963DF6D|nr:type IV pilus secretin family protein [Azonexus hydrophilus]